MKKRPKIKQEQNREFDKRTSRLTGRGFKLFIAHAALGNRLAGVVAACLNKSPISTCFTHRSACVVRSRIIQLPAEWTVREVENNRVLRISSSAVASESTAFTVMTLKVFALGGDVVALLDHRCSCTAFLFVVALLQLTWLTAEEFREECCNPVLTHATVALTDAVGDCRGWRCLNVREPTGGHGFALQHTRLVLIEAGRTGFAATIIRACRGNSFAFPRLALRMGCTDFVRFFRTDLLGPLSDRTDITAFTAVIFSSKEPLCTRLHTLPEVIQVQSPATRGTLVAIRSGASMAAVITGLADLILIRVLADKTGAFTGPSAL